MNIRHNVCCSLKRMQLKTSLYRQNFMSLQPQTYSIIIACSLYIYGRIMTYSLYNENNNYRYTTCFNVLKFDKKYQVKAEIRQMMHVNHKTK